MPFPISQPCTLSVWLVLFGTFLLNCYFRLLFSGMVARWRCCGKLSKRQDIVQHKNLLHGSSIREFPTVVEFQSIKMQKGIFNSVQYILSIDQANIIYLLISDLTLELVSDLMRSYDEKKQMRFLATNSIQSRDQANTL